MDYNTEIKNERMGIIRDHIAGGKIRIYTTGYALMLVEIDLDDPAASVTNGVLSLLGTPLSGVAVATGTPVIAEFIENDGGETVAINDLSVGISGTNIVLDEATIRTGQTIVILSGIIIHG